MTDLSKLAAEFPRAAVSWRAQSVTKDGTKAMALAYIDARDVMARLDEVCGIDGWQCDYPHAAAKTVCRIGIKVGDEWVWKANGAGDSDIEAEKGALSDAFKRAAVLWGIGRYLYAIETPWVPCEAYETEYQGKKKWNWKRWTADPWSFVRGAKPPVLHGEIDTDGAWETLHRPITTAMNVSDLEARFATAWKATDDKDVRLSFKRAYDKRKAELTTHPSPARSLDALDEALEVRQ